MLVIFTWWLPVIGCSKPLGWSCGFIATLPEGAQADQLTNFYTLKLPSRTRTLINQGEARDAQFHPPNNYISCPLPLHLFASSKQQHFISHGPHSFPKPSTISFTSSPSAFTVSFSQITMAIFKDILICITVATAVGTASATPVQAPEAGTLLKRNGCFSSGTEFSTGGFTVDTLAAACSSSFDGSYSSTQTKSVCINGSNSKRLNLSVKNNKGSNQELTQDA